MSKVPPKATLSPIEIVEKALTEELRLRGLKLEAATVYRSSDQDKDFTTSCTNLGPSVLFVEYNEFGTSKAVAAFVSTWEFEAAPRWKNDREAFFVDDRGMIHVPASSDVNVRHTQRGLPKVSGICVCRVRSSIHVRLERGVATWPWTISQSVPLLAFEIRKVSIAPTLTHKTLPATQAGTPPPLKRPSETANQTPVWVYIDHQERKLMPLSKEDSAEVEDAFRANEAEVRLESGSYAFLSALQVRDKSSLVDDRAGNLLPTGRLKSLLRCVYFDADWSTNTVTFDPDHSAVRWAVLRKGTRNPILFSKKFSKRLEMAFAAFIAGDMNISRDFKVTNDALPQQHTGAFKKVDLQSFKVQPFSPLDSAVAVRLAHYPDLGSLRDDSDEDTNELSVSSDPSEIQREPFSRSGAPPPQLPVLASKPAVTTTTSAVTAAANQAATSKVTPTASQATAAASSETNPALPQKLPRIVFEDITTAPVARGCCIVYELVSIILEQSPAVLENLVSKMVQAKEEGAKQYLLFLTDSEKSKSVPIEKVRGAHDTFQTLFAPASAVISCTRAEATSETFLALKCEAPIAEIWSTSEELLEKMFTAASDLREKTDLIFVEPIQGKCFVLNPRSGETAVSQFNRARSADVLAWRDSGSDNRIFSANGGGADPVSSPRSDAAMGADDKVLCASKAWAGSTPVHREQCKRVVDFLTKRSWLSSLQYLESDAAQATGWCPLKKDLYRLSLLAGGLEEETARSNGNASTILKNGYDETVGTDLVQDCCTIHRMSPRAKVEWAAKVRRALEAHGQPLPSWLRDYLDYLIEHLSHSTLHDRWIAELKTIRTKHSRISACPPTVYRHRESKHAAALSELVKGTEPVYPVPKNEKRAVEVLEEFEPAPSFAQLLQTLLQSKATLARQASKPIGVGHFMVLGNPGTGKSTTAKLLARFLREEGIFQLPPPQDGSAAAEECTGASLLAEDFKDFKQRLNRLIHGGILLIDEVHLLQPKESSRGKQIVDALMAEMDQHEETFIVIVTGQKSLVDEFLSYSSSLPSRFSHRVTLPDFSNSALRNIFLLRLADINPRLRLDNEETLQIVINRLGSLRGTEGFGNGRDVNRLVKAACRRQASRLTLTTPESLLYVLTRQDVLGEVQGVGKTPWPALQDLDRLLGISAVKERIFSDIVAVLRNRQREANGLPPLGLLFNRSFYGPAGVGKTTVMRIYARILCDLGVVDDPTPVEKTPKDLIAPAIGESGKNAHKLIESCKGKVLILDEAYQMNDGTVIGKELADTLVSKVEATPNFTPIILTAGYTEDMKELYRVMNQGLARRLNPGDKPYEFSSYSPEELHIAFRKKCKDQGINCPRAVADEAARILSRESQKPNFGNLGAVEALAKEAQKKAIARLKVGEGATTTLDKSDLAVSSGDSMTVEEARSKNRTLSSWYAEELAFLSKLRRSGVKAELTGHFLFLGNPGTGKSTSARVLGVLCQDLGYCQSSTVISTTPAKMQSGHVGKAGLEVRKVLESALGGVLLIDEAYGFLTNGYGKEMLDEIVAATEEEKFKNKIVIVMAGYKEAIQTMLDENEGAKSRFPNILELPDFSPMQCKDIFKQQWVAKGMAFAPEFTFDSSPDVIQCFQQLINQVSGWANARDVINFVDFMIRKSSPDSIELTYDDFWKVTQLFLKARRKRNAPATPGEVGRAKVKAALHSQMALKAFQGVSKSPSPQAPQAQRQEEHHHLQQHNLQQHTQHKDPARDVSEEDAEESYESLLQTKLADIQELFGSAGSSDNDIDPKVLEDEQRALVHELKLQRQLDEELAKDEEALDKEGDQAKQQQMKVLLKERKEKLRYDRKAKQALAAMGRCPAGYAWSKTGPVWTCGGGHHTVTEEELQKFMKSSK